LRDASEAGILVRYDAARKALADAVRVDEVKDIRDKAVAMRVYAMQANDLDLIRHATDIRMRAERRAGELLREMAERGERAVRKNMKSQPATSKLSDLGVNKTQSSRWQKLAELSERDFEGKVARAVSGAVAAVDKATDGPTRGTAGTGENEWYTPAEYVTLARGVLGKIDLDPATSPEAQKVVGAERCFTKGDDGLKQQWAGTVWLNPPYAQPFIAEFVSKMVSEWRAGRITAAIMLTHNYTDTAWFHEAASAASAICFTRGRIKFYEPSGDVAAPTQGQAFFYFGSDVPKFAETFAAIGFVMLGWTGAMASRPGWRSQRLARRHYVCGELLGRATCRAISSTRYATTDAGHCGYPQ
jgi:phage N-6-adenine-methyltransferase